MATEPRPVPTQTPDPILGLGALELRDRIAKGALTAEALTRACLAQIAAREPEVQAWAWLDAEYALEQAAERDRYRRTGRPLGPLHGLPVGIKDIIDTAKVPTENGFEPHKGRTPRDDAWIVAALKRAGAIIMGKTVTTRLAFLTPGKTRNPVNPAHTPGGSSSGSAAAVAAAMVPLAVGTQTGGSLIRPAAYCGVTGLKPTFGSIPRTGITMQSHSLDTVGVFAKGPEDVALIADALFGHDPKDPATSLAPFPRLTDTALSDVPVTPTFAAIQPPGWEECDDQTRAAFTELCTALGEQCFETPLSNAFDEAADQRELINFVEMAKYYYPFEKHGPDHLGPHVTDAMTKGKATPARDYLAALDWPKVLNAALDEIFERCDVILCPATPTPAPEGLESTGSAIFNGLWTFCGTPAVTVPLLEAENGLPIGVQLIGPRGQDGRLLRTARWLVNHLASME